jgi:hypothetical protein
MLRAVLLHCLLTGLARAQSVLPATDDDLTKKVDAVIGQWEKLKPGMSRAELEKVLGGEGGVSTTTWRIYVWPSCRYIKVNVEFNPTSKGQTEELPTDTIKSISKPYLEYSILN